MEYLFVTILILIFIYIIYNQILVLYYRYFKTFEKEIALFLKSNNLDFVEKRIPMQKDWENSPFNKPSNFKVSFVTIKISGLPITWTDFKYIIILGNNGNRTQIIWMQIKTTYFQKPKLKYVVK